MTRPSLREKAEKICIGIPVDVHNGDKHPWQTPREFNDFRSNLIRDIESALVEVWNIGIENAIGIASDHYRHETDRIKEDGGHMRSMAMGGAEISFSIVEEIKKLKLPSPGKEHNPDCTSLVATLNRFKCNCGKEEK